MVFTEQMFLKIEQKMLMGVIFIKKSQWEKVHRSHVAIFFRILTPSTLRGGFNMTPYEGNSLDMETEF